MATALNPIPVGDARVIVWNTDLGEMIRTISLHSPAVYGIEFASNNTLCSWSTDGVVRVWDVEQGRLVESIRFAAQES